MFSQIKHWLTNFEGLQGIFPTHQQHKSFESSKPLWQSKGEILCVSFRGCWSRPPVSFCSFLFFVFVNHNRLLWHKRCYIYDSSGSTTHFVRLCLIIFSPVFAVCKFITILFIQAVFRHFHAK